LPPVAETRGDRARQAADPGERGDAEDEAHREEPQSRQSAAKFAERETEGDHVSTLPFGEREGPAPSFTA